MEYLIADTINFTLLQSMQLWLNFSDAYFEVKIFLKLHTSIHVIPNLTSNSFTSLSFNVCSYYKNLFIYQVFRAANNGRSMDNVQSELGIDWTNLWVAGHVVRSLTDSLREILVFNYLINMRGSIHVSQRKKNGYKTLETN